MAPIDRRELMKQAVSVAGAAALARPVNAAEQASAPAVASGAQFFPGFTSARVKTAGVEINLVHAGSGPPLLLLHGVTLEFIQAYFHWFNYVRAAPAPEEQLRAQYDAQRAKATSDVQQEYMRVYSDPANIHGMCEDYRASASIDLKHDEESWSRKVQCPLLTLWGLKGPWAGSTTSLPCGRSAGRR